MFPTTLFLCLEIYVLATRGLIFAMLIVLLCVWRNEGQAEMMRKTLIVTYTGTTLIDACLLVVLSVIVFDVHLYSLPDCEETRSPCEVSAPFLWTVGTGTVFLMKALGLVFSFYRVNLETKDKAFKA